MLFVGILLLILHVFNSSKEHLTPGPPTIFTLQTDTQDLDDRLTKLKAEFDKMSAQAKQGADAAAQSKAQAALLKNS
jgi:hypothetical protein